MLCENIGSIFESLITQRRLG